MNRKRPFSFSPWWLQLLKNDVKIEEERKKVERKWVEKHVFVFPPSSVAFTTSLIIYPDVGTHHNWHRWLISVLLLPRPTLPVGTTNWKRKNWKSKINDNWKTKGFSKTIEDSFFFFFFFFFWGGEVFLNRRTTLKFKVFYFRLAVK